MVRSELIFKMAADYPEIERCTVEQFVDEFFNQIIDHLTAGGRIELRGFGIFEPRARAGRIGRNPRYGTPVEIPGKNMPFFKPGLALKLSVRASTVISPIIRS